MYMYNNPLLPKTHCRFWQGPVYPNATTDHKNEPAVDCGDGCLFNIREDPSEYNDLAEKEPSRLQEIRKRFFELSETAFEAPEMPINNSLCEKYLESHRGFLGPYYSDN